MNNFRLKVGLLSLLLPLSVYARFDFYKLAQDLDSHNNKTQFQAKRELHDYEDLEALLKQKLKKNEDMALVMKVIKVIHVKNLLPDLLIDAKAWAQYGVYSTINSLKDKDNLPLINKFYQEQIKNVAPDDVSLKDAYLDFYEYNNKQMDFPLLLSFLQDKSLDLRVKVAQYFYPIKDKYSIKEINQFSNLALTLGPYQLRLEVLQTLGRLPKSEIRKLKIDTSKCRIDLNDKIKEACKNIRKYF